MIVFRAAFLEFFLCFHVIGAAVLFRRFFPRESPWLGFFLPILVVLSGLNFIEHFVPLTNLGWLLPLTMGVLVWAMATGGRAWDGLALPSCFSLSPSASSSCSSAFRPTSPATPRASAT